MSDKHMMEGAIEAHFVSLVRCPACGAPMLVLSNQDNEPIAAADLTASAIRHLITVLTKAESEILESAQCEGRA